MRQEGPRRPQGAGKADGTRALIAGVGGGNEGQELEPDQVSLVVRVEIRSPASQQKFSWTFPHPHHTLTCLVTKRCTVYRH